MTFPLMKRMKAQVAMTEILTKEIFEEKIRNASSICVIGHVSPDGDCAGSVLGAYNYIKNMRGDDMDVVPYLEELNEKFSFLSGYDLVRSERDDRRYDLAVVCDCADPDRMGRFLKLFKEGKERGHFSACPRMFHRIEHPSGVARAGYFHAEAFVPCSRGAPRCDDGSGPCGCFLCTDRRHH